MLPVELLPLALFADRIWALRTNLTCIKAWYVAIAEAAELPLGTLDRRVSGAPGLACDVLLPL